MDWKSLKDEIEAASKESVENCPDDIIRVFEYGLAPETAGTGGLLMGPWFEGATASRYLVPYYVYNIIKLTKDSDLPVSKIRQLANLMMPKAMGTAKMSGMHTLADYADRVIKCINEMENRDEILELLNVLYLYGSSINAWQNYRVKWGLSMAFKIPHREDLVKMGIRAEESFL